MKKKISISAWFLCLLAAFLLSTSVFAAEDRNAYNSYSSHEYDAALTAALVNGTKKFEVKNEYGINSSNYASVFRYMTYSRPEIIGMYATYATVVYPNNSSYSYVKDFGADFVDDLAEERAALNARLPSVIQELNALIPNDATTIEKVLICHDYIVSSTAYDQSSLDTGWEPIIGLTKDPGPFYDYDITGPFVRHYGVCQGSSLAFKYLMDYLGIPCCLATSAYCKHAWNMVQIDGEWYHVDVTADDPVYDILGYVKHTYFAISTARLLELNANKSDFKVYLEDDTVFTDDKYGKSRIYESGQPWNETQSVCHYYNGNVYTIGADNGLYKNGKLLFLPDEHMAWHPFGNISAIYRDYRGGKLAATGNTLYLLTPKHIYEVNLDTEQHQIIYTRSDEYLQIFGLAFVEGELMCTEENDMPSSTYGNEVWRPVLRTIVASGKLNQVDGVTMNTKKKISTIGWSVDSEKNLWINGTIPKNCKLYISCYDENGQLTKFNVYTNEPDLCTALPESTARISIMLLDSSLKPWCDSAKITLPAS